MFGVESHPPPPLFFGQTPWIKGFLPRSAPIDPGGGQAAAPRGGAAAGGEAQPPGRPHEARTGAAGFGGGSKPMVPFWGRYTTHFSQF